MDTHTILDFEYSHLIIIKKTFYSLKNKASTGFLKIASTGQSILKLNDYYTHSTWTACLLGLLSRLTYTRGNNVRLIRKLDEHKLHFSLAKKFVKMF